MYTDPRFTLGVDVLPIGPPFRVIDANRTSPDEGGTLDRGLVGTLPDGREIIVGELWAAMTDQEGQKVSLDVLAFSERLVKLLNTPEGGS